jgi:hypothetical protein
LDEKQSVSWRSPSDMPEVDIAFASELAAFATYADAFQAAEKLLTKKSATPTWADVRPIEECACCGTDFDTRQPHHVLVLTEEAGDEMDPEVLQAWYVARLCPACGKWVAS